MSKILITGASGFVGQQLSGYFLSRGDSVIGIGTSKTHPLFNESENFEWISADTTVPGNWQDRVAQAQIIINLTGKSIFTYWTSNTKKAIYDSRVLTTRNLVDAIDATVTRKLLTTSAVGIYGNRSDQTLTETTSAGNDFLAQVCVDWEHEALNAGKKGVSVSIMRLGVVLGQRGGALSKMIPAFKCFMGGPLGAGKQWFPWVHIKDIEQVADFLIQNSDLDGPFNLVGPETIQQKIFAQKLGSALNRPAFIPAPTFIIKMTMGQMGQSLLSSQKAVCQRLIQAGYLFLFADVDSALKDIVGK